MSKPIQEGKTLVSGGELRGELAGQFKADENLHGRQGRVLPSFSYQGADEFVLDIVEEVRSRSDQDLRERSARHMMHPPPRRYPPTLGAPFELDASREVLKLPQQPDRRTGPIRAAHRAHGVIEHCRDLLRAGCSPSHS